MGGQFNHNHKIVCFTLWFKHHNNPRYATLFPRLKKFIRFYKVTLSQRRLIRGIQFRLWQALKRMLIYPFAMRYLAHKYQSLFTVDYFQVRWWPRHSSVFVDMDDPFFTQTEVRMLNLPQVRAVIVTTDKARKIYQELGISKPIYVIPQGVHIEMIDKERIQEIRNRFKQPTEVVIGYHAPTLFLSSDRGAQQREHQLDYLFAAVEKAHKLNQNITLWLIGTPSEGVKRYSANKPWLKLVGYIQLNDILNYVSNFDIGVYPRTWSLPPGRFSVKIAQFMACGVPIVATSVDEASIVDEVGCGVICKTVDDFSKAIVKLSESPEERARLGMIGCQYAATHLDWSKLVQKYEKVLKDEF